jgi:glucose/arabinose dehydrogenase
MLVDVVRRLLLRIAAIALVLLILAGIGLWLTAPGPSNPAVDLDLYLGNLAFPTALAFAPDGRIFYAERFTGSIRIIEERSVLPTPFFTLENTATTGEQGLLGLALHPEFPATPWVYAYQTFDDPFDGLYNRIVRIQANGNVGGALEVLLDPIPAASFHNGGVIAFAPDGSLFALLGDATSQALAQDLSLLNGKVVRLQADGSVPQDNPFVTVQGANPYVYTYGHRNMFGIAFHPETGRAYITENGPGDSDEVNLLVSGGNYGWPDVRGKANTPPYIDPLIVYTPPIAPTNAAFYTGPDFPASQGGLLFGDWNTRRLHALTLQPPYWTAVVNETILETAPGGILDVEMGPDGKIWFTTSSAIYRVLPAAANASKAFALLGPAFLPGEVGLLAQETGPILPSSRKP